MSIQAPPALELAEKAFCEFESWREEMVVVVLGVGRRLVGTAAQLGSDERGDFLVASAVESNVPIQHENRTRTYQRPSKWVLALVTLTTLYQNVAWPMVCSRPVHLAF